MSLACSLTLPWPPSINVAWYRGVKGRLTKKGGEFRDEVIRIGNRAEPLFTTSLRLELYFFPPDRRVRDNSNHTKVLYDALTKAQFWADDSLIKSETYYSGEVVKGGVVILYAEAFDWVPWSYQDVKGLYA